MEKPASSDQETCPQSVEPSVPKSAHSTVEDDTTVASPGVAPPGPSRFAALDIPGYEIIDELGRGGMGVVYLARQVQLNRPCALKMILAGAHASPQVASRFLSEAQAIARLHHSHIVQIYSIGDASGLPYVELEYVPGGSLDRQLDGTPWKAARAAGLVEQLARAVALAHAQGIIHRDLKPANVLLASDGSPKVSDFGLAKFLGSDSGLTGSDAIMGSPSYMAPEQAEGKTREVGPEADVYALGTILYELITGRPPFRGASILETLEQVKTAEAVPPSRLVPRLPRDIETISLKCLQKEPVKRYRSASALAEDLRRFQAGEPILARPIGGAERAWRWCRRNPLVSMLIASIAMALVLGTVVSAYFAIRATRGELLAVRKAAEALENASRADKATEKAREEKDLSDHSLYLAEMRLAHQAWQEGLVDLVQQYLQNQVPKRSGDSDRRGFEWYYLDRLCQSELRTLRGHSDMVRSVAFDSAGRLIASAGDDKKIKLWDTATGAIVRTWSGHTDFVWNIAFSPDGASLASAGEVQTIKLWDVATGRELRTLLGHAAEINFVSYSPGGQTLASAGDDGTVKLWDVATGKEIRTLRGHTGEVSGVSFSPDGNFIASAGMDRTVKWWSVATGREVRTLRGHTAPVQVVTLSPDGRTIASASSDRTIKLWEAATGAELRTLRGHTAAVTAVEFSPDGGNLASAGKDRMVKLWDPSTGREIRSLRGHADWVSGVSYSPDGRILASSSTDQTVKLWETVTDQEIQSWRGHEARVGNVSHAPDGRTLASGSGDRTVKLWDSSSGLERLTLRGHVDSVSDVKFSPDGKSLASAGYDCTVKLWDTATGKELRTLHGHSGAVECVSYSPDGRALASGGRDRTVKLWDAVTGGVTRTLNGHADWVTALSFSPDGRTIASASYDATIKLWDVATGELLHTLSGHKGRVNGLGFSPDGHTLASAGHDRTIKLWNASTGQELRTLHGHADLVTGVSCSPDGRTIASASNDGTVKLWDATTGQEILTLRANSSLLSGISYNRDGRTLAAGCDDGTVKVWDTTSTTAELQILREARSAVDFLFTKPLRTDAVLARIRQDKTMTAEVRARALALAESRSASALTHQAEHQVNTLYARPMFRSEVLASLRDDSTLSEPVRRQALALAEQLPENARNLDIASWEVVRAPGAGAAAYDRALRQAEAACRLVPDDGNYLNTLGAAQYRAGNYHDAVSTLTRSGPLNAAVHDGPLPEDLAFLALAQYRLGQTAQARGTLGRLREAMKNQKWAEDDEDAQSIAREAETIELDLVFPADPFAR
jgi:WD40 repeat protein